MNYYQRKYHGQIEITDLVGEAVSNIAGRRNQVLDSEEPLLPLSNEQTESIKGGYTVWDAVDWINKEFQHLSESYF
jgi:hypothetical protein